jgi:hypothetical protein
MLPQIEMLDDLAMDVPKAYEFAAGKQLVFRGDLGLAVRFDGVSQSVNLGLEVGYNDEIGGELISLGNIHRKVIEHFVVKGFALALEQDVLTSEQAKEA